MTCAARGESDGSRRFFCCDTFFEGIVGIQMKIQVKAGTDLERTFYGEDTCCNLQDIFANVGCREEPPRLAANALAAGASFRACLSDWRRVAHVAGQRLARMGHAHRVQQLVCF